MKYILYVLDIGVLPMHEIDGLSSFEESLLKEKRVAGVWYREMAKWQETINQTRADIFDDTRTEVLGDYEINILTLLVSG